MSDHAGDGLLLTHELIAQTLGVRRGCITVAASALRSAGLIGYERGHIRSVDRGGLEVIACGCYRVIKREYDRLYAGLPGPAK